jgi:hypothetical protein
MPGDVVSRDDEDVIATFRLVRQTSRWSRLAAVTLDVVPAVDDAVSVAATPIAKMRSGGKPRVGLGAGCVGYRPAAAAIG